MELALKLVVTVGTDSTTVRMQHRTIVQLRCDTMYVLHGFIPVEEMGIVSTVMGTVVDLGTRSVPMKNPNWSTLIVAMVMALLIQETQKHHNDLRMQTTEGTTRMMNNLT